jgi:hypothetical protein
VLLGPDLVTSNNCERPTKTGSGDSGSAAIIGVARKSWGPCPPPQFDGEPTYSTLSAPSAPVCPPIIIPGYGYGSTCLFNDVTRHDPINHRFRLLYTGLYTKANACLPTRRNSTQLNSTEFISPVELSCVLQAVIGLRRRPTARD